MMITEVRTWKKFLVKYGRNFTKYRYDVHVGKGIGKVPGYSKTIQNMAVHLTQKRIDVVAARGNQIWLIEIKDRASMAAIGQLLTYRELYYRKYGYGTVEGLIVVAESSDPDVAEIIERFGIRLYIV